MAWARRLDLIDDKERDTLLAKAGGSPSDAKKELGEAKELREALSRLFLSEYDASPISRDDLDLVAGMRNDRDRGKRTNWLLIKHHDEFSVDENGAAILEENQTSVASGRTMEMIATGRGRKPKPFMVIGRPRGSNSAMPSFILRKVERMVRAAASAVRRSRVTRSTLSRNARKASSRRTSSVSVPS